MVRNADTIRYRTFTVDTYGRVKKADGYRITVCTDLYDKEKNYFEIGIAICQGKHYVKHYGQDKAYVRMCRMNKTFEPNDGELVITCIKDIIIEFIEERNIRSLRQVTSEDLK